MKKSIIIPIAFVILLIGAVIIANTASRHSCSGRADENITEKNDTESCDTDQYVELVIPSFVQELGRGEWVADTICVVNGETYYYASEDFGIMRVIYHNDKLLIADPALMVDSFASGCRDKFYVSVVDKSRVIDFSNMQSLKGISSISQQLPAFTRYKNDSVADFGHTVFYSLSVDFPKESVPHADEIRKWLVDLMVDSQTLDADVPEGNDLLIGYKKRQNGGRKYKGDIYDHNQIAKFISGIYFAIKKGECGTNDENYPSYLFSMLNLEARVQNDRYVSYQQCTHDYNGGIHGYYTERLISYDHVHQQEIDFDYLFNPQCRQQLLDILLEVAKNHPKYKRWGANITERVCLTDEKGNPTGEWRFPQPGLSDEGVVFSFQPYEINCFAAGTYHFTIPYNKVENFLAPKGKWCIGM